MSQVLDLIELEQQIIDVKKNDLPKYRSLLKNAIEYVTSRIHNLHVDFTPLQYQSLYQQFSTKLSLSTPYLQTYFLNITVRVELGQLWKLQIKAHIKHIGLTPINFLFYQPFIHQILNNNSSQPNVEPLQMFFIDKIEHFGFEPSPDNAKILGSYILGKMISAIRICDGISIMIEQPLENIIDLEGDPSNLFRTLKISAIEIMQPQRFYKYEASKNCFIRDPASIQRKNQSVARTIYFYDNDKDIKPTQLFSKKEEKQKCGFSRLSLVWRHARILSTIMPLRKDFKEEGKLQQFTATEGKFLLVKKEANSSKGAAQSIKNEFIFMRANGHVSSPYVCNMYFRVKDSQNNIQKLKPSKQLYLEYHEKSAYDFFSSEKYTYSMLDIINFGLQLMTGLLEFYIQQGYLHRDMKESNTLISKDGIVKIIDNGSVYPIEHPEELNIVQDHIRSQLDQKLRSTYYVNSEEFYKQKEKIKNFSKYTNYQEYNSVHETFDVYAVGYVLIRVKREYMSKTKVQCLQLNERWSRLTRKMTHPDPNQRLTMKQAQQQLISIKKFFFRNTKL